jgi:hypothetical protein
MGPLVNHTFLGLVKIIQDLHDGEVEIMGNCMILMIADVELINHNQNNAFLTRHFGFGIF